MQMKTMHHLKKLVVTSLCVTVMGGVALNVAANNKERYEARYSEMSRKAAEALLTDVQQVGNKLVTLGERGHILVSEDQGKSWKQAKVPTVELLTAVHFVNEQYGWAVGHEGLILHSKDGGATWEVQYADPYYDPYSDPNYEEEYVEEYDENGEYIEPCPPREGQPLLDVWFKNEKEGFVVGAFGSFFHTTDGGITWEDWTRRLDNGDCWHLNAIGTKDGNFMVIVGEKGTLFGSSDGGKTWNTLPSPYDGSFFGAVVGPKDNEALIFGLQGHIYKTEDNGKSWREIFTSNTSGLMSGTLIGDNGVILVGNGGVIMHSKDGGNSFVKQVTKDRQSIVGIAKINDEKLVMVGKAGVTIASPNHNVLGIK